MGYLELILGPMFSGKTSRLIQIKKKYAILDYSVLIIKPLIDNRYSQKSVIVNHDLEMTECLCSNTLSDILDVNNYQVILIEEAQFFNDLYQKVIEWSKTKKVYVAGLNGDANQNLFGELYKLISHADEIVFLKALCKMCKDGTAASFTVKRQDSDVKKIVDVGGKNLYQAVCREHLLNN